MSKGNTKEKIIKAAETIISKKGKSATIGEIGTYAGVTDSVIYHHFKNKEDVIFSVLGVRLNVALDKIDKHLSGIRDPLSKMTKLIWLHLHLQEEVPDDITLLIFEYRSNANYRKHEAYELNRRWAKYVDDCLKEGRSSGAFSADLNVALARDAILGLMDMENLFCLAGGEKDTGMANYEGIVELVLAMLQPKSSNSSQKQDRRHRILESAETVFAQKGYDNATISYIAEKVGVSEPAIYECFKNKEDLLFSTLDRRFAGHVKSLDELFHIVSPLRKLRRFMRHYFTLFSAQPKILKTFLSDGIYNRRFFNSTAYTTFMQYLLTIDSILDEGKKKKCIREEVDNRIFRNLFLGAFCHITLRWQFTDWKHGNMLQEINQVVDLITRAVAISEDDGRPEWVDVSERR